jgi:Spy/CpxP family protein refolding chaperone
MLNNSPGDSMQALTRSLTYRPLRLLTATLALALAGGFIHTANAQPMGGPGGPGMGHHADMGQGMGPGMGMGAGMAMGGRQIEHMLYAVNATPEQRAQIKQILQAAQAELKAQRDAGRKLHEQGQALFTQPAIDARAAETLRQQMLAQHDVASKRMLQAMLDVSRVLTPEQRKTLGERLAQRRGMMERHRAEREALDKPAR